MKHTSEIWQWLLLMSVIGSITALGQSFYVPMGDVTAGQVTTSADGRRFTIAPNDCAGSIVISTIDGPMVRNELLPWPLDPIEKKAFGRITISGLFNDGRYLAIGRDHTASIERSRLMIIDGTSSREIASNVLAAALTGNERYVFYVVEEPVGNFRSHRLDLWQNTVMVGNATNEGFWALSGDMTVNYSGTRALIKYRVSGSPIQYQVLTIADDIMVATMVPMSMYKANALVSMDGEGRHLWTVETDSTRQTVSTLAAKIIGIDPAAMTVDRTIVVPEVATDSMPLTMDQHQDLCVDRIGRRFAWSNRRGYHFMYDDQNSTLQYRRTHVDRAGQVWSFLPGDSLCVASGDGYYSVYSASDFTRLHSVVGIQPMEIKSLRLTPDLQHLILLPERRIPNFDIRIVSVPNMQQPRSLVTYHTMDSYDEHLYYTRRDCTVVRMDVATGREDELFKTRPLPVIYVSAADNGTRFMNYAHEGGSSTITIVEGGTGTPIFSKRERDPKWLQLSKDGKIAVIDTTVWDVDADTVIPMPRQLKYPLSPDGRYALFYHAFMSGSTLMRQVIVYDLLTRKDSVLAQGGIVQQDNWVSFSRDGSSILMVKTDGEFARYSLSDRKQTHRMKVHLDNQESSRFSCIDYVSRHDAFLITPDYHRVEIITPNLTSIPDTWTVKEDPPLIHIVRQYLQLAAESSVAAVSVSDINGREWPIPFTNDGSSMRIDLDAVPNGLCLVVVTNAEGSVSRHVAIKMP